MPVRDKSVHQQRVEQAMIKGGQSVPEVPDVPPDVVILLRAKLIFEEAMETIVALGVRLTIGQALVQGTQLVHLTHPPIGSASTFEFKIEQPCNLALVADGCADLSVVTIGTLSAFGIADESLLALIDESNLAKFVPPKCPDCGHIMELKDGAWLCGAAMDHHRIRGIKEGPWVRDDGKYMKPPYWKAPEVQGLLNVQTSEVLHGANESNSTLFDHINQYERLRFRFWKELVRKEREDVFVELGIINDRPLEVLPQTMESGLLDIVQQRKQLDALEAILNRYKACGTMPNAPEPPFHPNARG